MSQALYDLPEGWEWVTIADLINKKGLFTDGDWVESKDQDPDGEIRLIQLADIGVGVFRDKSDRFLTKDKALELKCSFLNEGDILFARMPDPIGRACLFPKISQTCVTVVDVSIIRPFNENVLSNWLVNVINSPSFHREVLSLQKGTTRKRISRTNLSSIKLPLPPLTEQSRIVEKLDAVLSRIDTAIDELQQSLALVDAMFKSGLDKAFNPLGSPTNEAGLYDLPDGWGWRQLHSITDVVSGYAFKSEDFSSDIGIPSVKITNVGLGAFVESQDDYLPSEFSTTHNKFSVKEGDIVIALTRPVINGGLKVCRVPKSYAGALVNQRVAAVMCNQGAVLEYVYWYLLSPMTLDYVVEKSKSLNQPNLSIKDLSKLEVPLPPLSEQQRVVEALDALNDKTTQLKTELTAKIDLFNQLKASVLDGAFRGEL